MKRCEDTKTWNTTCHSLRNVRKHFTFGCTCPIWDPRHTRHFYQLQSGPCHIRCSVSLFIFYILSVMCCSNVHQILYESSEIKSRDFRFGEDKDNAVRLSQEILVLRSDKQGPLETWQRARFSKRYDVVTEPVAVASYSFTAPVKKVNRHVLGPTQQELRL